MTSTLVIKVIFQSRVSDERHVGMSRSEALTKGGNGGWCQLDYSLEESTPKCG